MFVNAVYYKEKYYFIRGKSLKKLFTWRWTKEVIPTLDDWIQYLDDLLKMNKLEILEWKWKVSRERAEEYVKKQMAEYQEKWWSLDSYTEWAEYILQNK